MPTCQRARGRQAVQCRYVETARGHDSRHDSRLENSHARSVRGDHANLRTALAAKGWPTLEQLKGKFLFLLLNKKELSLSYLELDPLLRGRSIFREPHARSSFGELVPRARSLLRRTCRALMGAGFLATTMADHETLAGPQQRREAARARLSQRRAIYPHRLRAARPAVFGLSGFVSGRHLCPAQAVEQKQMSRFSPASRTSGQRKKHGVTCPPTRTFRPSHRALRAGTPPLFAAPRPHSAASNPPST
jgi:hypothetical protein